MAILETTADLKLHASLSEHFEFDDFKPFIAKAVNKFTRKYLGELHSILADEASEENAEVLNQARYYLQEVIVNFGLFLYLPLGSVMFDGSGLSNVTSDNRTPLSGPQMNDIRRGFLTGGHEAMDLLLSYMESNKEFFPAWSNSSLYSESKELIINNAAAFNKWYNIFESRQTYLALQPALRQIEDQYLKKTFCRELIGHLKNNSLTAIQKELQEELQKAVVALTVAKVCNEGLFLIEATGIRIKYDALSHETVQNVDYGKPVDFINKTAEQQYNQGMMYLQNARALINTYPEEFNQCASPIIENSSDGATRVHNTSGVVGLI